MGDKDLVICRDCKHTAWLEDYEVITFIQEHGSHNVTAIQSRDFEDLDSIEAVIRELLGWSKEA